MSETTSRETENAIEAARAARIASARSDFVGSFTRRVAELRGSLGSLEHDRGSSRLRDDLRRRVHALSAGARLLRFSGLATALADAERTLERAAAVGGLELADVRILSSILDTLPSLVGHESSQERRPSERPSAASPKRDAHALPPTVLVVGASGLADAITHPIDHTAEGDIECERTDAPATALDLARALAPDVAVVDADLPGANELIEKLGSDPLTEPMPLIVVGTWSTPEEGARWVALGASRALGKPVSPHELRKACLDLGVGASALLEYPPLGQVTVDELTARIIEEVKRGLPDALVHGKSTPIQLGDGSDVLAAVWGAVARIRDLLLIKSGGAVRFSALGPEGAFPIAPWWGDNPTATQRGADPRPEAETSLKGRRVVVADDDPAVIWFIGGVLRAAGADVREAHDGERALELCFRSSPDLVISDVLMPGLDGFAVCRALKRDIALRDVPVILLSWKEDLLQRLRDLGADADGYLRKEASAAAILQRVYEVLRTRTRIEMRLQGEGEVRGRLDGVTPRTLLEVTARSRRDARVCVRDASFLYEVELRLGSPISATRTASDGSFQRGKEVFGALLGVRSGRFVITRATGPARGTLQGDLDEQLASPLAHARAALQLLSGTRLLEVHRVSIALDRVLAYLAATPEPARSLIVRLADGASPRGLILGSEVAPTDLEDVLSDLATHGAIVGVQGSGGTDLLGPALHKELAVLQRGNTPSYQPEAPSPTFSVSAPREAPRRSITPPKVASIVQPAKASKVSSASASELSLARETADDDQDDARAPSSLEAAVIRQISEYTPVPPAVASEPAISIVDASALKARAPTPSPPERPSPAASEGLADMASLPPDAVVPGSPSEDRIKNSPATSASHVVPAAAAATAPASLVQQVEIAPAGQANERPRQGGSSTSFVPVRSSFVPGAVIALIVMALLGVGLRYGRQRLGEAPPARVPSPVAVESAEPGVATPMPATPMLPVAPVASPSASGSALEAAPSASGEVTAAPVVSAASVAGAVGRAAPTSGEDLPLPTGAMVAAGQGLLDIETEARDAIFVDGTELGRGPFLRLTLAPGVHELRLRGHGEERVRFVVIRANRRTRLSLSSPWAR